MDPPEVEKIPEDSVLRTMRKNHGTENPECKVLRSSNKKENKEKTVLRKKKHAQTHTNTEI